MLLLCVQLGQNKATNEKNLANSSRYQARSVVGYSLVKVYILSSKFHFNFNFQLLYLICTENHETLG